VGVLENVLRPEDYVIFCLRQTADFYITPTGHGPEEIIMQHHRVSREFLTPHKEKAVIMDPGLQEKDDLEVEHYPVGCHYESGPFFDCAGKL